MQGKDLYRILGVDQSAGADAIKKAYRKLAKEYHPDKHPGDKGAEQRFKEISQAYSVLGDPKKRQQYDQIRKFGFPPRHAGGGFQAPGADFDFSEIFGNAARTGGRRRGRMAGGDFNLDDFFGFDGLGNMFSQIFETQQARSRGHSSNGARTNPNDIQATLEVPFKMAALGGKMMFKIPNQNGKQVSLNIPAGTQSGKKLRLSGQGKVGANGHRGDLLVTLKVPKHRFFEMRGFDVHCEIPLEKSKAKKGTKLRVKTIHSKTVELKIPMGTKDGQLFRLAGMGILHGKQQGDQYVKIKVK